MPDDTRRRGARLAIAAAALALAACSHEDEPDLARPDEGVALVPAGPLDQPVSAYIQAGVNAPVAALPNPYEGDADALAEGERLFLEYNCVGCHWHSGTGLVAPSLADDRWRYGRTPAAIYASIHEGRPLGMPAFGGRVPPDQIWKLAAYVRSLSQQGIATSRYRMDVPERTAGRRAAAPEVGGPPAVGATPPTGERP